eukprot:Hpha_TRINITY_DN2228_c0_g1::TRINITY_DN2228_c0_g1_i1::g.25482::m.25482
MGLAPSAEVPPEEGSVTQGGKYVVQLAASKIGGIPGATAYHTSVVVDGEEYFFDGSGINTTSNLASHQGAEPTIIDMGKSRRSGSDLKSALSKHFGPGTYDLLLKNCNSFSDAALMFLLGRRIDPSYRQLERVGAANSAAVEAATGGQYKQNESAVGFDLEAVCATVDPQRVWKTPGQQVGGGEAADSADAMRAARLKRFK